MRSFISVLSTLGLILVGLSCGNDDSGSNTGVPDGGQSLGGSSGQTGSSGQGGSADHGGSSGQGGSADHGGSSGQGTSGSAGQAGTDGTWQGVLESQFDVVDTFDDLADWRGGTGYHWDAETMPHKIDGSPSIWSYYTNDTEALDDWIKDHGTQYRWGDSGKSLCVNYNNFVGGIDGYGPSRLGTFLGDGVSSSSGYKKIHVFFMVKFREGFFAPSTTNPNEFAYVGVIKFFDLCTGFTAIDHWGTAAEYDMACDRAQTRTEYGLNDSVINIVGGGLSTAPFLFFRDSCFVANNTGSCWDYTEADGGPMRDGNQGTFQDSYLAGEWIGVEVAMDLGTVNASDGSSEVWVYSESGVQMGHHQLDGQRKLVQFDHAYNKVVLGGNRFGSGYDLDEGDSDENRFYVDDFIVHGEPIGPTYFALRSGR